MRRFFPPILFLSLLPAFAFGQPIAEQVDAMEVELTLADSAGKLPILLHLIALTRYTSTEQSTYYAQKAEAYAKALGDTSALALAYYQLGETQRINVADYDQALLNYLTAADLQEALGSIDYYQTRRSIAGTYQEVNDYAKALEVLVNDELTLQAQDRVHILGQVQLQLGELYRELGQGTDAKRKLLAAQALFEAEGDYGLSGATWNALGLAHELDNDFAAADSAYQQAAIAYQKADDRIGLGMVALYQGKLRKSQGQASAARTLLRQALGAFRSQRTRAYTARTHWELGDLAFAQREYSEAVQQFEASLDLALASNDKLLLKKGYESLYNLYVATGDIENAIAYKDRFLAMGEFVYKEANEQELGELRAQALIKEKEGELEKLQAEQELQSLKIRQQNTQRNFLFVLTILMLTLIVAGFYFVLRIRRNNDALNQSNHQIQRKNEELATLNGTKDKFFSIIAHDLKGPLASLRSFANLLINYTDSMTKEEIQNLATDLDGSLKNLFSLLENLLTWARAQTGGLAFEPSSWKINKVISETLGILEPTAQKKEITLQQVTPEHAEVFADRNMITTVIRNLVSNALKFTQPGGKVTVLVELYADAYEIAVRDTGVGMPPQVKQKLFKVGEKVTTKGTANEKGTGLGLILCKEFVEKNGGSIWVESEEGAGSTFRFTLPKSVSSLAENKESSPLPT